MSFHRRNAVRVHPNNVPRLVGILGGMGFREPLFQEWRVGQRFGLSRQLTNLLEWHIRGFADGTLDSEVEISRNRLQHLAARPGSYYSSLVRILLRNGILFHAGVGTPTDARHVYLPEPFGRAIPIQVPHSVWW